ncbi:MAG: CopC domain, partial [Actinomycetota bacterium]|nr:CopC domain [Actinomycetota bacterium]
MKRLLLLCAVAIVGSSAVAIPAFAHPAYKDSSPQSGATVSQPPTELWIDFTESIESGTISIYDPCGDQVDHGDEEMNLTKDRLTTAAHGDRAGTYRVQW